MNQSLLSNIGSEERYCSIESLQTEVSEHGTFSYGDANKIVTTNE